MTDRERGCTDQAHHQGHGVPEQAQGNSLTGRDAPWVEQQREHPFPHAETADRDGQHLHHRDRGDVRQDDSVRDREPDRVDGAVHGGHDGQLVGDGGDECRGRVAWVMPQSVDAEVHDADEPRPVGAVHEPACEPWAGGEQQDDREHEQGADGDHDRDPRARRLEEVGTDGEAEEHEDRERHEAGEPLEHHRRERDLGGARVLRAPADAEHVAADRRGQRVPDELAGEVVLEQDAQRHVRVVDREHALPSPGGDEEAQRHDQDPRAEEREGAGQAAVRGHEVVGVDP